jgi:hypothetical protein
MPDYEVWMHHDETAH